MEMNFPHKSIRGEELQATTLDADQRSAYDALLASVIARQALSRTARLFVAQQGDEKTSGSGRENQSIYDRMNFFAGQSRHVDQPVSGAANAPQGSFHPGLSGEQSGFDKGKG